MHYRLDGCTSREIEDALCDPFKCYGVILPIGSLEQHGPMLPLGCDMTIARSAAEALAANLLAHPRYRAFVLPDLSYTPSPGAEDTPGTVSVGFEWMGQGLLEVLRATIRTAWAYAIIINGHAHNHGRVIEASIAGTSGALERQIPVLAIHIYDYTNLAYDHGLVPCSHAGEFETALLSYYSGYKPAISAPHKRPIRPRPPAVYGLPILSRSMDGVIAPETPDTERALAAAAALGADVDAALYSSVLENLDIYFSNWHKTPNGY
jgi:creatinine amidohydrolase/Fe(II)-dependent formamide hydrolase-like protein